MPDIELLTGLDLALMEQGIIDFRFSDEYHTVHEAMRKFRSRRSANFSAADLLEGEKYLRRWLGRLRSKGYDKEKLVSFLRCGLGHLCYDFIEFTYEMISPEDIVRKSLVSFQSRDFHRAILNPPKKTARKSGKKP
jgi:hypothetical protein